jgi:cyclopropane fatty-acyl-phospholipid synthase-like methyltransferase
MSQVTSGVRAVLSRPAVYELWSGLVGGERARRVVANEYVRADDGDRVLDIGCGPAELLGELAEGVDYTGVDLSPSYIASARQRFGARGTFRVGDAGELQTDGTRFDIVLAIALIHHLDDAETRHLFATAAAMLAPEGRFVTLDCVHVPRQNPVARAIIDRDRGQHVRTAGGYEALAREAFSDVRSVVRHDMLRIPYTHCILECRAPVVGAAA